MNKLYYYMKYSVASLVLVLIVQFLIMYMMDCRISKLNERIQAVESWNNMQDAGIKMLYHPELRTKMKSEVEKDF